MNKRIIAATSALLLCALLVFTVARNSPAQTVEVRRIQTAGPVLIAKRHTLAIRYKENDDTSVNITGTALNPQSMGKAEVKRKDGRTRVKLKVQNLGHPQALGAYYTTYILWAIAPEGQADNLAELPIKTDLEVEVTTAFQTFGLIITGEPHSGQKPRRVWPPASLGEA